MDIILDSRFTELLIQDVDAAFVDKLMSAKRAKNDYQLKRYVETDEVSVQDITVVRPGMVITASVAAELHAEREAATLAAAEEHAAAAAPVYCPELDEVAL